MSAPTLILASQSASRRAMLTAAGIPHEAVAAQVDEDAAKASFTARGLSPRDTADALAELKAAKVATLAGPAPLVLGCDSIVALADGTLLDKPRDRDDAAAHLAAMSGATHDLWSAAVIHEAGRPVWRHVERARMTMRPLSGAFIDAYLDAEWPAISGCVGCYRIEGSGVQLFARIEGSHFTILGLPLLPLAAYLRERKILPS
ncbi:Maf family protein [Sphingomonas baiyangensis]|uniref:Nucleoside triphosphate pyrophosphatase n=1 Tax=Sphingomonas baiyangensis TaxID=2572576 RepID=A0A4U1L551_9SPHN|nr:nucleoside triphosphate pyrophosphatase [Sphingomonas baiyangensis]TKD51922.1 Maf-like protein [Sphingomonas baiyangensis]